MAQIRKCIIGNAPDPVVAAVPKLPCLAHLMRVLRDAGSVTAHKLW
jgi:hypothetical protein